MQFLFRFFYPFPEDLGVLRHQKYVVIHNTSVFEIDLTNTYIYVLFFQGVPLHNSAYFQTLHTIQSDGQLKRKYLFATAV